MFSMEILFYNDNDNQCNPQNTTTVTRDLHRCPVLFIAQLPFPVDYTGLNFKLMLSSNLTPL